MFARRKRKEKLILIVVNLLIVDNILLFYKLINADKCINEHGLYKYQEQCHKYPNEIIKGIVQSNKTLEQISNEHNPLRLNNGKYDKLFIWPNIYLCKGRFFISGEKNNILNNSGYCILALYSNE